MAKENSVEGRGLKTLLRGIHPTAVIFDDPLTMENADSLVIRDLVRKKFDEALKLTKNIIVVGQPSHEEDLYQFFREKEDTLIKVDKLEIWNDDIKEMKVDLDDERARGSSERAIQANYNGILIVDDTLPFYKLKTEIVANFTPDYCFIDPAFEGKDDIGLCLAQLNTDDTIIALATSIKGNILDNDLTNILISEILEYNPNIEIFVESNDGGGAFKHLVNITKDELQIIPITNNVNKEKRIRDRIVANLHNLTLVEGTNIMQIRKFKPSGKNQRDDTIDALSSMLWVINNYDKVILDFYKKQFRL